MIKSLSNLTKAAVSVMLTPITLAVDVCTLPESAYNDRHPFSRTGQMLTNAGKCAKRALEPK